MPNSNFAIVIGASQYPHLKPPSPGQPNNLSGPDHDAAAIYDWLTDPAKGNLHPDNALRISSADYQPFDTKLDWHGKRILALPSSQEMIGCFGWLITKFQQARSAGQLFLGDRLYIYLSGHGFSVGDCDGGLYDSQAHPLNMAHFYVTSWFDWFYRAAAFKEYVLWVDACSDLIPIAGDPGGATVMDMTAAGYAKGKRFVAFAAKHSLQSVERQDDQGTIRGVFTSALLQGLNGAAVDQKTHEVSSASLQGWLNRGMIQFMDPTDITNGKVANKPAFGPVDDMSFGHPPLMTFTVQLEFANAHLGHQIEILNNEFDSVFSGKVTDQITSVELPAGYYRVEVGESKLKFEVRGRQSDAIIIS